MFDDSSYPEASVPLRRSTTVSKLTSSSLLHFSYCLLGQELLIPPQKALKTVKHAYYIRTLTILYYAKLLKLFIVSLNAWHMCIYRTYIPCAYLCHLAVYLNSCKVMQPYLQFPNNKQDQLCKLFPLHCMCLPLVFTAVPCGTMSTEIKMKQGNHSVGVP